MAIQKRENQICGQEKQAIIPKAVLSERAIILDENTLDEIVSLSTDPLIWACALRGFHA